MAGSKQPDRDSARDAGKHAPAGARSRSGPRAWQNRHLWEIQPVRDLLLIAAVFGVVYLGYLARVVTTPMLLALLLAYLCEPLVRLARGRGMSRRASAIAMVLIAGVVIVVPLTFGTGFAAVQATKAVRALTDNVSRVRASVAEPRDESLREAVPRGAWRSIRDFVVKAGAGRPNAAPGEAPSDASTPTTPGPMETDALAISDRSEGDMHSLARLALTWLENHGTELGRVLGQRVVGGGAQAVGAAVTATVGLGYLIFTAILTAFFFYFFCLRWENVTHWFAGLIPDFRRSRVLGIVARMDRVIAGFVRGRLMICCILGTYLTFGYFLAGVPAWAILGPLIGACFIVPFLPGIGLPVIMLLMWLDQAPGGGIVGTAAHWEFQREWWWIVGGPILVHGGAQVLDDYVLTPRIQGKTTDMSVPTILFASLAGGAIGGLYGLLIAIPTAACVKILAEEVFWPRVRAWVRGEASDILPIGEE